MRTNTRRLASFLIIILFVMGCTSQETKKARHLERGDSYFDQQKYKEAIIEYRNVLQMDGNNPYAVRQIAFAHYALGEAVHAFPYLVKAKELEPEKLDIRMKLAALYFLGREFGRAKQELEFTLERDPNTSRRILCWQVWRVLPMRALMQSNALRIWTRSSGRK